MKSKIRIEMDFDLKEPVLNVLLMNDSDDARDKLLQRWVQNLGGESSWARINFKDYIPNGCIFQIESIHPSSMKEQGAEMLGRVRVEGGKE